MQSLLNTICSIYAFRYTRTTDDKFSSANVIKTFTICHQRRCFFQESKFRPLKIVIFLNLPSWCNFKTEYLRKRREAIDSNLEKRNVNFRMKSFLNYRVNYRILRTRVNIVKYLTEFVKIVKARSSKFTVSQMKQEDAVFISPFKE